MDTDDSLRLACLKLSLDEARVRNASLVEGIAGAGRFYECIRLMGTRDAKSFEEWVSKMMEKKRSSPDVGRGMYENMEPYKAKSACQTTISATDIKPGDNGDVFVHGNRISLPPGYELDGTGDGKTWLGMRRVKQ